MNRITHNIYVMMSHFRSYLHDESYHNDPSDKTYWGIWNHPYSIPSNSIWLSIHSSQNPWSRDIDGDPAGHTNSCSNRHNCINMHFTGDHIHLGHSAPHLHDHWYIIYPTILGSGFELPLTRIWNIIWFDSFHVRMIMFYPAF